MYNIFQQENVRYIIKLSVNIIILINKLKAKIF